MTYKTAEYIKCEGVQIERIESRIRLAFVRCPKCRRYVNLYKDELNTTKEDAKTIKSKKCSCGLKTVFILEGWHEKN